MQPPYCPAFDSCLEAHPSACSRSPSGLGPAPNISQLNNIFNNHKGLFVDTAHQGVPRFLSHNKWPIGWCIDSKYKFIEIPTATILDIACICAYYCYVSNPGDDSSMDIVMWKQLNKAFIRRNNTNNFRKSFKKHFENRIGTKNGLFNDSILQSTHFFLLLQIIDLPANFRVQNT